MKLKGIQEGKEHRDQASQVTRILTAFSLELDGLQISGAVPNRQQRRHAGGCGGFLQDWTQTWVVCGPLNKNPARGQESCLS